MIENHSLKPYKQRVLGTYVLLESTLKILTKEGQLLKQSIETDKAIRPSLVPMSWNSEQNSINIDSIQLLAIESKILKSSVTNADYVQWTGKPITTKIANYNHNTPADLITRLLDSCLMRGCY